MLKLILWLAEFQQKKLKASMEFKALIKNTGFMMVAKIAQFAAGLITTKLNAVFLGVSGVGIINQLNFLTQKISEFTTLSMAEAVVKQIAENKNEKNANEIISSAFKSYIILVTFFSAISILLLLLFSEVLSNYIFGNEDLLSYFFIAVFTFPLLIIGSIPFAILK
jgi:PST family polysaccharide transporter